MKLLFFTPHAAIWVHAFPEALIAEALQAAGHEIVYVTCGREFRAGCNAMTAHGLSSDAPQEDREKICEICEHRANLLRRQFRLRGSELGHELQAGDQAEIARIMA